MARPKNTASLAPEPDLDQDRIDNAMTVMRQDAAATALVVAERNDRVTALAAQLQYQGATDPSTLENSAREAIRRIGMGIFELGAYLLMLREACERGHFLPALERLNIEPRAAQRYMGVTRRFATNTTSMSHLEGAGIAKLVELLPLDDEKLEELTELGQTGELKLDDVAGMSVRELRAKVRTLMQDGEATKAVLDKKNKRIDKLERELVHFERATPDEKLAELQTAATRVMNEAVACIQGQLRQAVVALGNSGQERGQQDHFIAGLVAQVQTALTELRAELGILDQAVEDEPAFAKALSSGNA